MAVFIPSSELSVEKINGMLIPAFIKSNIDDDGDIIIKKGSLTIALRLFNEDKTIRLFSLFSIKNDASTEDKENKLANKLNVQSRIIRFTIIRQEGSTILFADYNILYDSGIYFEDIIMSIDNFLEVRELLISCNEDDIIL
jgi:hypothetical protein